MRSSHSRIGYVGLAIICGIIPIGCKKSAPTPTQESKKDAEKPSVLGGVRLAAARTQSANNLKQIGLAFHNYAASNGHLPSAMQKVNDSAKAAGRDGIHGWRVQILPFIEQQSVSQAINPQAAVSDSIKNTTIATYRSPVDDKTSAMTHYRVFVGNGAAFEPGKELRLSDFKDGLANTILAVEAAEPVNWADGIDLPYDPNKPLPKLGIFPGGFNALMGDASVRWIPEGTDEKIIRAMITRSGNEKVDLP